MNKKHSSMLMDIYLKHRVEKELKKYDSIVDISIEKKTFKFKRFLFFKKKNIKTIVRITVNESVYVADLLEGKEKIEQVIKYPLLVGDLLEIVYE